MWFLSLLTISLPFVLGSTDKRIRIIQKEGLHSYNANPLCTWLRSTKESIWHSHQRQDHSWKGPIGYLNSPGNSLSHHWRILEAIWCLIEEPVVKWPLSASSNACQKEGQKGWVNGSHRSSESSRKVLWVWTSQVKEEWVKGTTYSSQKTHPRNIKLCPMTKQLPIFIGVGRIRACEQKQS